MSEMILRDAMSKALREALDQDERVFLMGEDIGAYGGAYAVTKGFLEEYGEERIRDTRSTTGVANAQYGDFPWGPDGTPSGER